MPRLTPYLQVASLNASRAVYEGIFGLSSVHDDGERVVVYQDGGGTELIVLTHEIAASAPVPDLRIEVSDVDATYERVVSANLDVVYPLTDERWARRFFFKDVDGHVYNVLKFSRGDGSPR